MGIQLYLNKNLINQYVAIVPRGQDQPVTISCLPVICNMFDVGEFTSVPSLSYCKTYINIHLLLWVKSSVLVKMSTDLFKVYPKLQ